MNSKYQGMTVNERLYESGQFDEFDNAIKKGDKEKVTEILMKVELNENSILPILKSLGLK